MRSLLLSALLLTFASAARAQTPFSPDYSKESCAELQRKLTSAPSLQKQMKIREELAKRCAKPAPAPAPAPAAAPAPRTPKPGTPFLNKRALCENTARQIKLAPPLRKAQLVKQYHDMDCEKAPGEKPEKPQ